MLLRPLPYRDPARLMMIWEANHKHVDSTQNVVSPGNYLGWRARTRTFQQIAAFRYLNSVLSDGHRAEELKNRP